MKNPYEIVRDFENAVCEFTGANYGIAVDNCTNALFLCCKYLNVQEITIPSHTYVSVPCAIKNAGGSVKFENIQWAGKYQLKPYPIWDSACELSRNMYNGQFMCLSFSYNKILPIGKGGMILTNDSKAMEWFKLARYEGRSEVPYMEDSFRMIGWNMYMTPEQASRGLALMQYLPDYNTKVMQYPDLSKYDIYTKN